MVEVGPPRDEDVVERVDIGVGFGADLGLQDGPHAEVPGVEVWRGARPFRLVSEGHFFGPKPVLRELSVCEATTSCWKVILPWVLMAWLKLKS